MSKKRLGGGFDAVIGMKQKVEVERARNASIKDEIKHSSQSDNKEEALKEAENVSVEVKTTMYIDKDIYEKVNAIANWKRESKRDLLNEVLEKYVCGQDSKMVEEALAVLRQKEQRKRAKKRAMNE